MLDINEDPVSIKLIERSIVDRAFEEGLVKPGPGQDASTGKKIAVDRLGPGRAWPPRSNWRAPVTTSRCSSATTASAGSSPTASPTSRWKSRSSSGASQQMAAEGVVFKTSVRRRQDVTARAS